MIRLYRAPFSTNVDRVAIALALKGLETASVVISYEDRSPVIEVSGQGLVPVIVDDGEVIADSTRILRHLDERYPYPRLFPTDPARRAEVDIFLEWFNEVWKAAPNGIEEELEKPGPDHERVEVLSGRMRASLGLFEGLLADRDYLFGELSAADLAAIPFLKYARARDPADDELFHRILEEHQQLGGDYPRLAPWIERVDALPRA
ncbi:MAG: glutathione S-transferase family protein [Thermoleophilaceae bacterium]